MARRFDLGLFKEAFADWMGHDAPTLGASLSYYTTLSMAPLVVIVVGIVGLALGESDARGQIIAQVRSLIGSDGARAVEAMISSAHKPGTGILASSLAVLTLLFGASGVFTALQDALNKAWDVPPPPKSGWFTMVRQRLFSFGMVLAVGFLLLVSLIVSAALTAALKFVGGYLPFSGLLMHAFNIVLSLVGLTIAFALIYRFVPNTRMSWRDCFFGAAVTAVLFTIGKTLIGLYLGTAGVGSAYGAAGSLVIILVWVYYSAQIFLLGAEFTRLWAKRSGRHALPAGVHPEMAEEPAPGFGSDPRPTATPAMPAPASTPTAPPALPAPALAPSTVRRVAEAHGQIAAGQPVRPAAVVGGAVLLSALAALGFLKRS